MSDHDDRWVTPLDVATDLTVTVEGTEARLHSTGDRLFLEFPSVVAVVEALRTLPESERRRLHGVLKATDLTLEVRARQRTIAVFGAGAAAGPLSRHFGVDPAELRVGSVLSAIWAGVRTTVRRLR